MKIRKIELDLNAVGRGVVLVDGFDISEMVSKIEFCTDPEGGITKVNFEMVGDLVIKADAQTKAFIDTVINDSDS